MLVNLSPIIIHDFPLITQLANHSQIPLIPTSPQLTDALETSRSWASVSLVISSLNPGSMAATPPVGGGPPKMGGDPLEKQLKMRGEYAAFLEDSLG